MAQHNQEQQLQATISFPTIDISDDSNLPPEPDCPPSCYTANVNNALKAAEDGEGADAFEEQECWLTSPTFFSRLNKKDLRVIFAFSTITLSFARR